MKPEDVEWFREVTEGQETLLGPTWDTAFDDLEDVRANGSPCECHGTDHPSEAGIKAFYDLFTSLRDAGIPPPYFVYAHCRQDLIAEWVFAGEPGSRTRVLVDFWPKHPERLTAMATYGIGVDAKFREVACAP